MVCSIIEEHKRLAVTIQLVAYFVTKFEIGLKVSFTSSKRSELEQSKPEVSSTSCLPYLILLTSTTLANLNIPTFPLCE